MSDLAADLECAITLGDPTRTFEVIEKVLQHAADVVVLIDDKSLVDHWYELAEAVNERASETAARIGERVQELFEQQGEAEQ